MLACVINVSEGRDLAAIARFAAAAGAHCLDVHTDPDHHRTVFWLAGPDVETAARALATEVVNSLSLTDHDGVHPRIGVLDVVPFVPITDDTTFKDAVTARNEFARWAGDTLKLPCFLYGAERSLPDVRKHSFVTLPPDTGPAQPHPLAGGCAVGARMPLVAYNLWLQDPDLTVARQIARDLRSAELRTLALQVGDHVQVSCNLVAPLVIGPAEVFDAVAAAAPVARAELVGLIGRDVLARVPSDRWEQLDLGEDRTVEARLEASGLGGSPARP